MPLVDVARLYENVANKSGRKYFTIYLGKARVLLLEDPQAAEGQPKWRLLVQERDTDAGTR